MQHYWKIGILFCLMGSLFWAQSPAFLEKLQNTKINLEVEQTEAGSVVEMIGAVTELSVTVDPQLLSQWEEQDLHISLNAQGKSVKEILEQVASATQSSLLWKEEAVVFSATSSVSLNLGSFYYWDVVSLVGFPDKAPALIEESLLLTYLRDKVGKAVWSSPDAFLWISQGTLIAFNQKNIHEEITKILAQLQAHSGNLSDLIPPSLIVIHEKMNQNRLTLNFEETPLREVFTFLEDLSSIPFYLDTSLTSSDLLISLSLQEVTFLDVLVMISHLKDFYFYYEDERVVVKAITPRLKKSLEEIPDTFQGKQFSEESSEEPAPRPSNPLARLAQTQVTLDFSDTPLSDIFEFLGQTSGVPIRFDEKLTSLLESSFSFQLSNVPVDSVFDLLSFYFSLDWAIVDQKVLFKPAVFEEEVVEKKLTLPSDLKGLSNQGLKAVLRGASGQKKWFSPKTFLKVSEGEVLAQNTAKVIQELEAFLAQSPEKRKGLSPEIHALENRLLRTMVTLDFEKTPLEQIFYFLADVSGVSFCKHPQCLVENPDNEITIQLEKVSLEKVLQEICALKNLEYRYMEGGIVSISPQ